MPFGVVNIVSSRPYIPTVQERLIEMSKRVDMIRRFLSHACVNSAQVPRAIRELESFEKELKSLRGVLPLRDQLSTRVQILKDYASKLNDAIQAMGVSAEVRSGSMDEKYVAQSSGVQSTSFRISKDVLSLLLATYLTTQEISNLRSVSRQMHVLDNARVTGKFLLLSRSRNLLLKLFAISDKPTLREVNHTIRHTGLFTANDRQLSQVPSQARAQTVLARRS